MKKLNEKIFDIDKFPNELKAYVLSDFFKEIENQLKKGNREGYLCLEDDYSAGMSRYSIYYIKSLDDMNMYQESRAEYILKLDEKSINALLKNKEDEYKKATEQLTEQFKEFKKLVPKL